MEKIVTIVLIVIIMVFAIWSLVRPYVPREIIKRTDSLEGMEQGCENRAVKGVICGFLWLIGGGVVTLLSLWFASEGLLGGFFVVTWGAVLYGIIKIIKNLVTLIRYYYTKKQWNDIRRNQ